MAMESGADEVVIPREVPDDVVETVPREHRPLAADLVGIDRDQPVDLRPARPTSRIPVARSDRHMIVAPFVLRRQGDPGQIVALFQAAMS